MALSKKVITFSLNTSTGNQSITGVGFQPELVILFCNGTGSVAAGNGFSSLGAATSSTARWAIGQWHTDGAAASETSRSTRTDQILDIPNPAGSASDYQADLVSMDSDGFTINIGATPGVALRCVALCLAGTDLDVAVGSFNTGTTTGTGITAVSGLAFQPKAVLTALATTSASVSATTRQSIGFASGSTNEWGAALYENDNNATMVTSHGWSDARYINSSVNTSDDTDIAFNAFTSDGWTHDITTTAASWLVCYIAFGGSAQYYVGNDAQKTTTGTEPTTGAGFTPSALITNMGLRTTSGYDADGDFYFHVGFMDGTSEAGGHVFSDDGTLNAETSRGIDETYSLFSVTDDATPTVAAKASLSSFDSDGFTVDWNTADATARLFGFLAIGAAAGSSNYTLTGAVTHTLTPAATFSINRQHSIAGAVSFTLTPSATLAINRAYTLTGAVTHTLTPAATMAYTAAGSAAITGAVTYTLTPSATFAINRAYTLSGAVTHTLSVAAAMQYTAQQAIELVGAVTYTLTPQATMVGPATAVATTKGGGIGHGKKRRKRVMVDGYVYVVDPEQERALLARLAQEKAQEAQLLAALGDTETAAEVRRKAFRIARRADMADPYERIRQDDDEILNRFAALLAA